jgi:exopolysaccharide biosynthesis polyprenyl glycosylphosphotransferase
MASKTQRDSAFDLDMIAPRSVRSLSSYTPLWTASLIMVDLVMFVLAAYVAGAIVDHRWDAATALARLFHSSIIFVVVWFGMFYRLGLYRRSFALSYRDEFYFTVIALIFGVIPQLALFSLLPQLSTSRLVLLLATIIAIGAVGTSRSLIHLARVATVRGRPIRILLVGHSGRLSEVRERLQSTGAGNLEILTFDWSLLDVGAASTDHDRARVLLEAASNWKCDRTILVESDDQGILQQLLAQTAEKDVKVAVALPNDPLGAYEALLRRYGDQDLLVPVRPNICRPTARLVKRIFDVIIASIGLVVCSPVLLLAGLLVLLDSGKPIFFQHDRVGRYGHLFKILKFRTMRNDADSTWAKPGDERITRVGAWLRRMSIDELPQLFNVLRGDMSLVGPRPEMREYEENFARTIPFYEERRLALPGVTGWAQVNMRRNLTPDDVEQVLRHDLFYIKHWSIFLDFTLLLKTATEFLFHRAI